MVTETHVVYMAGTQPVTIHRDHLNRLYVHQNGHKLEDGYEYRDTDPGENVGTWRMFQDNQWVIPTTGGPGLYRRRIVEEMVPDDTIPSEADTLAQTIAEDADEVVRDKIARQYAQMRVDCMDEDECEKYVRAELGSLRMPLLEALTKIMLLEEGERMEKPELYEKARALAKELDRPLVESMDFSQMEAKVTATAISEHDDLKKQLAEMTRAREIVKTGYSNQTARINELVGKLDNMTMHRNRLKQELAAQASQTARINEMRDLLKRQLNMMRGHRRTAELAVVDYEAAANSILECLEPTQPKETT
jgi:hypothetical protein